MTKEHSLSKLIAGILFTFLILGILILIALVVRISENAKRQFPILIPRQRIIGVNTLSVVGIEQALNENGGITQTNENGDGGYTLVIYTVPIRAAKDELSPVCAQRLEKMKARLMRFWKTDSLDITVDDNHFNKQWYREYLFHRGE